MIEKRIGRNCLQTVKKKRQQRSFYDSLSNS